MNNFEPFIKKNKNRKQQSAISKITVTKTGWDAKRSEKQELGSAKRSSAENSRIGIGICEQTRCEGDYRAVK